MQTRALIVDDQSDVLFLCSQVLKRLGYQVQTATSGEEALELFTQDPVDLLVTDIMMPGMTGTELLTKAHEIYPGLAAVVITGFGDMELAVKCLRAGAHDFVTKPFSIPDLREAVEHALVQAQYAQESARLHALLPLFELSKHTVGDISAGTWSSEIIDIAISETGAQWAGLLFADEGADTAYLSSTGGEETAALPDCASLLEAARDMEHALILTPEDEIASSVAARMQDLDIATLLCAHLHAPSRFVGALVVAKDTGQRPFGQSDIEIISILSSQTAAFLENVRLLRQVEEWNRDLEKRVRERTAELRETQDQLLRSERLATIGKLGAGVAHELRNPLGVINNSVYYLRARLGDNDSKVSKHLGIIGREVETANGIITDLMGFVKSDQVKRSSVRPELLIQRSLERAMLPDEVCVHTHLAEDLPPLLVDTDKIEQIFINLINNAAQAMPGGGELYVSAELQDNYVEFVFRDTGMGIPVDDLQKIFEPLFTTKAKGIGLGLSIVKLLVEAHQGEIKVKSKGGEGASFIVRLPCEKEKVTL